MRIFFALSAAIFAASKALADPTPLVAEFLQAHPERQVHICAGAWSAVASWASDSLKAQPEPGARRQAIVGQVQQSLALSLQARAIASKQVEKDLAPLMISRWQSRLRQELDTQGLTQVDELLQGHCRPLVTSLANTLLSARELGALQAEASSRLQASHPSAESSLHEAKQ